MPLLCFIRGTLLHFEYNLKTHTFLMIKIPLCILTYALEINHIVYFLSHVDNCPCRTSVLEIDPHSAEQVPIIIFDRCHRQHVLTPSSTNTTAWSVAMKADTLVTPRASVLNMQGFNMAYYDFWTVISGVKRSQKLLVTKCNLHI